MARAKRLKEKVPVFLEQMEQSVEIYEGAEAKVPDEFYVVENADSEESKEQRPSQLVDKTHVASGADLALFTDNEPVNKFGRLSNKPSMAIIEKEEKFNLG